MVVFNNLNSVRRKYHLVLLATWDFSKFGCLIFKSATAKDFRLQGSELFPPSRTDASCISDFLSKYRRRFFEKSWFTRAFLF